MSNLIGIYGESGSGKSTSIRTLDPKETFIINVANKPLPIRGYKKMYISIDEDKTSGNYHAASDHTVIERILNYVDKKRPEIKQIIIDDAGYSMSFEMMDRAKEKGFEKFTEISQNFYTILKTASGLRDDLSVVVFMHSESNDNQLEPKTVMKVAGKMITKTIGIEGLFTYVIYAEVLASETSEPEYRFCLRTNGINVAKTPMGCFEEPYCENDLQFVLNKIQEFNEG